MLGQARRGRARGVGLAIDPDAGVDLRQLAAVGSGHAIEQAAGAQAGIGRHLVEAMDRAGRDRMAREQLEPVIAAAGPEDRRDPRHQLGAHRPPPGVGRQPHVLGQVRLAERAAQALPDGVVADAERERLIRGLERLIDREHAVAGARAPGQLARAEVGREPRAHEAGHALDQGDVDLVSAPGALAVEESGDGGERGVAAGEQVGGRGADLLRRRPGLAGQVHDP